MIAYSVGHRLLLLTRLPVCLDCQILLKLCFIILLVWIDLVTVGVLFLTRGIKCIDATTIRRSRKVITFPVQHPESVTFPCPEFVQRGPQLVRRSKPCV